MAPRRSKPAPPPQPTRTLVIDNGAHTLKAGFVTADVIDEPTVVPNCVARDRTKKTYVGSDLSKCKDFGEISFRRPVDKGYIVNWEAQKEVWDHEFFSNDAPLKCDPAESRLILTEQPNSIPALQTNCDQMVFEEFGFASYYRGIGKPSRTSAHPLFYWRGRAPLTTCQGLHSMHTTTFKPSSELPSATPAP
jgi:actin-related protein 6